MNPAPPATSRRWKRRVTSLDLRERRPVVSDAGVVVREAALVVGVVDVRRDVEEVRQFQGPAAVRDAGRDLDAGRAVAVAHEEGHGLTLGLRALAQVVQRDLERAYAVPPVGLRRVQVPGLGGARIHQRVAELAEVLEEAVGLADDLAKKPALIRIGGELLDLDAREHWVQSLFAPC